MSESSWRFHKFFLIYLIWTHYVNRTFCIFTSPLVYRILLLLHPNFVLAVTMSNRNGCCKPSGKVEMQNLTYTNRGLGRRRNSDRWEADLSHTNPVTGKTVRTFHTVEGKTRR